MSKLDELINELCPNGVEWKSLGEVAKLSAGGDVPKDNYSKEISSKYTIPIFSNGIGENALYGYTNIEKINVPSVTISARGTIGYCELRKEPYYPIVRLISVIPDENLIVGYLKYFLDTVKFKSSKSGIPQLTVPMIKNTKIPIPPLEVQEEIVRILDNFTEHRAELEAELEAELKARKKQYEYYRNELLTFGDDVEWKTLGEVCELQNGFAFKSILFKETGKPILRITNIQDSYVTAENCVYCSADDYTTDLTPYIIYNGDIVVAMSGATTGKIGINKSNTEFYLNQRVGKFIPNKILLNNKYLYYWLKIQETNLLNMSMGVGAQPNLSSTKLKKIPIPIPPLSEQKRIVEILDRFDKLCYDISAGLPAEIEARQKQYEYYRDQLLTFKELKK